MNDMILLLESLQAYVKVANRIMFSVSTLHGQSNSMIETRAIYFLPRALRKM